MKNKKIWKTVLQGLFILAGVGVGLSVGFFGAMYMEEIGASAIEWIFAFVAVFSAFYFQIILHEAGHLIFGLLSGYRFVSFRVDSFMIYKKQEKFHFGKYTLAGTGGQCLMAPPDLKDGMIPYRLFNMGGVIVNLIVTGISALLFFFSGAGSVMGLFHVVMALIGLFYAIINGIPMRMSGVDNDGYNALSLGKDKEALYAFWLQLKINEQLTEGKRLKDMPEEWFEKPSEEGMKNSMAAAIEAARCNRLLDEMKFEETSSAIEDVLTSENGMVGLQKNLLKIDRIFCEILGEEREHILEQMQEKELKAFMKAMKTFPSVIRTQYAYALLIENDKIKAEKHKRQLENVLKMHPNMGEAESESELVAYCEQRKDTE